MLKTLGQGAYGLVLKVCPKTARHRIYALKELRKDHVLRFGKVQSVIREKDILMQLVGLPFFIQFECTFQDEEKLYFLTEYVANGTLQDYITEWKKVPVEVTKHIAARLVASLEALHKQGICHRDLKPQNVLLTASYETKLCDFGEAKVLAGLNPVAITREFKKLIKERLREDG